MRARKKPVEIEFYLWPWFELAGLSNTSPTFTRYDKDEKIYAIIKTLEGELRADVGDVIIRGIKGELYPCKPDIFYATYDIIKEDATTK